MTVERWTPASRAAVGAVAAIVIVAACARAASCSAPALVDRLTALFIYVILAAMWNALAGFGGLVSVGQQVFFGLGAYFTIRLADAGIDPFLSRLRRGHRRRRWFRCRCRCSCCSSGAASSPSACG